MFDQRLNQLSSQIAQMTPQQRQQFAVLHKNDPILVSLTKFVNDQDQATKQALLAKTAPQAVNQPKVVDQTIAQMRAPLGGPPITPPQSAQQGVGGLPAPNLAGMPDGGIAGQPDAQQAPKGPGMAAGGAVRSFAGDFGSYVDPFYGAPEIPDQSPKPYKDPRLLGPVTSPLQQERDAAMEEVLHPKATPAPSADTSPKEKSTTQKAQDKLLEMITSGGSPGAGGIAALGGGAPGMKLPADIDPSATYDKVMADRQKRGNPMQDQLDELGDAQRDVAESKLDSVKRNQAEMGIAGIDREKRLNARSQRLDANYGENKASALVMAGLAMMSGTSRNAFVNIGQGAQVGMKQFTEGKQRLDEARDKLDDAFGQLEDLRRNEKRLNMKELTEAETGVKQSIADHMKTVLQSTQDMYGVDSKTASHIVDANIAQAGHKLGYLGHVQSSGIMAGASDRASQRALQGHIYSANMSGLASLSNGLHDPSRYSGINAQAIARFGKQAEDELKGNMSAIGWSADQRSQWVSRRTQELAEQSQAMGQSGGASSAVPNQDPTAGWGQLTTRKN